MFHLGFTRPLVAIALVFLTLFTAGPIARAGNAWENAVGINFFEDAPPRSRPRAVAPGDEAFRSRRRVRVRRELLQAPTGVAAPLRFNLFPGVEFTAVLTRDERTPNGDRILAGTLVGVLDSQFLVVVHGEEVVADIFVSPLERYQLRREPGEDGAPEVRRLDPTALPPCGGGIVNLPRHRPTPRPAQQARGPVSREVAAPGDAGPADDPGVVDVLIAYTPAARVQLGGSVASVEAQAQLAVQGLNDRLRSSQVRTQARLVHTMEVSYAEVGGDLIADLTNLEDPTGILTTVHQARDLYAADLVSLFVAGPPAGTTGSFVIGLATFAVELDGNGQVQGLPEQGFTVVEPFYDVANTFAHEVGHNFGCQHDREHVVVDGIDYGPGLFPFSYGWRFYSAGHTYRDLMSYAPGTIIPYYSNPQVSYGYEATGVVDVADNARTMNASAAAVANLRRLPVVSVTAPIPRAFETPTIPGQFTVARTGSTARSLTVNLHVSFIGSAASFETLPDQITIPAGRTSVDLPVVPVDDDRPEARRGATLQVLAGDGYRPAAAMAATQATVYLLDTPETVSIAAIQPTATRNPLRAGGFRLTRSGALDAPLTVFLRLDENSLPVSMTGARKNYRFDPLLTRLDPPIIAESDALDYSVDIPSGSATLDLTLTPDQPTTDTVQVLGVSVVERDRYQAGQPRAAVNILDRPMEIMLSELSIVAVEPTASAVTGRVGRFVLTRSQGVESTQLVTVYLSGSAAYGLDYSTNDRSNVNHGESGFEGFFFIPAGQASFAIEVRPEVDPRAPTRAVLATVGLPGSPLSTIAPTAATATVTILGQPSVSVEISGPEARATSDLGPVYGEFTIRRNGDLAQPLTVRYATGGTAVGGIQYKALPGVATIPAGQDFVRVKVKPKGDAGGPGSKTTVKLTLQAGDGYVLGDAAKAKVKVIGAE